MTTKKINFRAPLAKVKYYGAAHSGTGHFIKQRVTALVMIPLIICFIYTLLNVAYDPNQLLPTLAGSVFSLSIAIFFVGNYLFHGYLGLQMIFEDYIHCKYSLTFFLITTKVFCIFTFIAFVMSLLITLDSYIANSIVWQVINEKIQ